MIPRGRETVPLPEAETGKNYRDWSLSNEDNIALGYGGRLGPDGDASACPPLVRRRIRQQEALRPDWKSHEGRMDEPACAVLSGREGRQGHRDQLGIRAGQPERPDAPGLDTQFHEGRRRD